MIYRSFNEYIYDESEEIGLWKGRLVYVDTAIRRTLMTMVPRQVTIRLLGFAITNFVFRVASFLAELNLSAVCAY